jgi:BirA family biotin operon repressor/biotin-[acetyl-CoA-carboxylase] ligase
VTLLAGAALAEALRTLGGLRPQLKWPNDVELPGPEGPRKVAGVLTEMASDRDHIRHLIVGIGLNVNTTAFPPALSGRATSLRLATGRTFDRGVVLARLLDAFEAAHDRMRAGGGAAAIVTAWRAHARLGHRCQVDQDGATLSGVALDVGLDGALAVRDDQGRVHRILSGELRSDPRPG